MPKYKLDTETARTIDWGLFVTETRGLSNYNLKFQGSFECGYLDVAEGYWYVFDYDNNSGWKIKVEEM